MLIGRDYSTCTIVSNEMILLVGGGDLEEGQVSAEFYDPVSGVSTMVPWRMRVPRIGHTATKLPDGRVVIIGGNTQSRIIEVYNPPVAP